MSTKKGARGYRRAGSKSDNEHASTHPVAPCEKPSYEIIDHTADLGIRVTGESLEKLFENAGLVLFDLLTDLRSIRSDTRTSFALEAENPESLFVQWLRELLHFFYGRKRLFCAFEITELSDTRLTVTGWGERLDPNRHVVLAEIKAVTYHELSVTRTESGWTAQVIFDV